MQTLPRLTSDGRPSIAAAPIRRSSVGGGSLTPAQRVALTIALLNHGLDVVDHAARTWFVSCARRMRLARNEPRLSQGSRLVER
jgi:hypothetical protein